MLLYSRSYSDEKRSEYMGKCVECGASLYRRNGRLIPDCEVEDGHRCRLYEEYEEEGA